MNTVETEKELTGYPSIDKPWLKYYSEEAINAPLPEESAYQYILEKNKNIEDDTALVYFKRKISYKKMFKYIDDAATAFLSVGVKKGDIVILALPNIPENIYCIYALNKIGAVADLIDLRSKGDTLLHYFEESEATIAVVCSLFAKNTFEILKQTNIDKLIIVSPFDSLFTPLRFLWKFKEQKLRMPECAMNWKKFMSLADGKSSYLEKSNDVACIFHTSGTTGLPKGVMLTNQAFNAMDLNMKGSGLRSIAGEVMMNQIPPFLAYNTLCATHISLAEHFKMILLPDYQPDKFASNIIKLKPNYIFAGPADWSNFLVEPLLKNKQIDLSFLLNLISGSDSMPQKIKDGVNKLIRSNGCTVKIQEGYGMTEIGAAACANVPQHNVDGSVGIPLPCNNFCIYDNDAEKELTYNEIGEICMSGPTLMKGYYKMPEETAKVLRLHKDGNIWLHSGDLGYISETGNIYLEGRLKRIIVRHDGIKVSPFNLEKIIMKHSNIVSCCVVGGFDQIHQMGQVPIAYLVLKNNDNSTIAEVGKLCEQELSETYLPHDFRIIESLPLTPNGKIDYRSLEEMANL
ncbi:MAG: acyl--CoA ligase [Butyrivibrio sp.]|nr:acyl--CoA ligase [Butyrivibrio sp.]